MKSDVDDEWICEQPNTNTLCLKQYYPNIAKKTTRQNGSNTCDAMNKVNYFAILSSYGDAQLNEM